MGKYVRRRRTSSQTNAGLVIVLQKPTLKENIYELLADPTSSSAAKWTTVFLNIATLLSCSLIIVQTMNFKNLKESFFDEVNFVLTTVFTVDFLGRLLTCPCLLKEAVDTVDDELQELDDEVKIVPFFHNWLNWVDLFSILPFYLDVVLNGKIEGLDILRLCRMLRILKMTQHFSGTTILLNAVRNSAVPIKVAMVFLLQLTTIFGVLMFLVDPCYDRENCGISDAFNGVYFVLVTITTVGYGDIIPAEGHWIARVTAVIIMVMGSLFLAMPLMIIGSEFEQSWRDHEKSEGHGDEVKHASANIAIAKDRKNAMLGESSPDAVRNQILNSMMHSSVLAKHEKVVRKYLDLLGRCNETRLKIARFQEQISTGNNMELDKLMLQLEDIKNFRAISREKYSRLKTMLSPMIRDDPGRTESSVYASLKMAKHWKHKVLRKDSFTGPHKMDQIIREIRVQNSIQHLLCEIALHIKRHNLQYTLDDVAKAYRSERLSDKLWLMWEVPLSSKAAHIIHRLLFWTLILVILLTGFETMTEFQIYGESTHHCEVLVQEYCEAVHQEKNGWEFDPACFVNLQSAPQNQEYIPLKFGCRDPAQCTGEYYGKGLNFGSPDPKAYRCDSDPRPFRNSTALQGSSLREVCRRWQCYNNHAHIFDGQNFFVAAEWHVGIVYTIEFLVKIYTARSFGSLARDMAVWIDFVSMIQLFYLVVLQVNGDSRSILISPGNVDWIVVIRMIRVLRIFELHKNISGIDILYTAMRNSSKKLSLPYFFLVTAAIVFSFLLFEFEKGVECLYPKECSFAGRNITYKDSFNRFPPNKRLLLRLNGDLSPFTHVFSSFWFTMSTITSVGYGRMTPVTQPGKMLAVMAMLFGACYTAMPLTLVGGQFYKSYCNYRRKELLLKNQFVANKPILLESLESRVWCFYRANVVDMLRRGSSLEEEIQGLLGELSLGKGGEEGIQSNLTTLMTCARDMKEEEMKYQKHTLGLSVLIKRIRHRGELIAQSQSREKKSQA